MKIDPQIYIHGCNEITIEREEGDNGAWIDIYIDGLRITVWADAWDSGMTAMLKLRGNPIIKEDLK